MKKFILLILLCSCFSCKTEIRQSASTTVSPTRGLIAENAMVVSAREEASMIGLEIMKEGGNAFDAMMATEMALAVTFPFAGSLGGGGFMVYRKADGETGALDYREKAPLAATKNMYLDGSGNVDTKKSRFGALAVGVPGNIAGSFEAHARFGSLPVEQVLQPVIDLAKKGFVVSAKQEQSFNAYRRQMLEINNDTILFARVHRAGDTIRNLALAKTLERIVKNGRSEFYSGETAQKLVSFLQESGGIITLEDLEMYKAQWREPVTFSYKDLKIISMSPPSSGGIALAQIMKMIEPYPLQDYGHNSSKYIQVLTEAERRAYADRSQYLGDPDFVEIPTFQLTSVEYLHNRMDNFNFEKATPSSELNPGSIPGFESNETTHYSIVDSYGNAIAVTTTLNGAYGSKLYAEELGFFLNNEMDDFSAKPGVPNMFGLIGGEANAIAPQKRMLSSMTPTLVERDDHFWMSLGSPGGSTIITSVLQTILNVYEFDMTMQQAVDAPRFHHQWLPDEVLFEPAAFETSILNNLKSKGYHINEGQSRILGKVDAILRLENGSLEGGADHRGDDTAAGF
ncbi:gamma-glutamyltransferase [Salinimicrobium marinum]|uniref:Glutathione hydrolase proenzyme n=1 Tax=Salinimicrobium marinum TaxID=680283 RepID=A0A918VW01_9FLAO|nr:gamma-glutamyltransferase [Salinimicrobium marinum]GHA29946.1 gamma-glutamyltransferase [Salinimicrobium marinum]